MLVCFHGSIYVGLMLLGLVLKDIVRSIASIDIIIPLDSNIDYATRASTIFFWINKGFDIDSIRHFSLCTLGTAFISFVIKKCGRESVVSMLTTLLAVIPAGEV